MFLHRHILARSLALGALFWASVAHAQYVALPNHAGVGAGQAQAADIDARFTGTVPIAPKFVSIPFASLPAEVDGQLFYVPDGSRTIPCAGGGSGAFAFGVNGVWQCTSPGASGGTVSTFTAGQGMQVGTPTTAPSLTIPNNTWWAQGFAGATAAVQINACLTAAATTKGTCDARGITDTNGSATIAVPANTGLIWPNKTITFTVLPAVTYLSGSRIICDGPVGFNGSSPCGLTLSGTSGPGAAFQTATGTPSGATIQGISIHGTSNNTDGTIGFDLQNATNVTVSNSSAANIDTGIRFGGNGNGSYYNISYNNTFGGVLRVGLDFQQNANANHSMFDMVHSTSATYGWLFETGNVSDDVGNPDCESLTVGHCIDIASSSVSIYGTPYFEASKGGIFLESTAVKTLFMGTGNASSMGADGAVNYGTADKTSNVIFFVNGGGSGGQLVYPQFWGAFNYYVGLVSDASEFTLTSDTNGLKTLYTVGRTAETSGGHSGLARINVGATATTGGIAAKGSFSLTTMATPSTPTCVSSGPTDSSTTYKYAVVGYDWNGNKTKSSGGCTLATGNVTLGGGSCNVVSWNAQDGVNKWDIIGNLDFVHSLQLNIAVAVPASPGGKYVYTDCGAFSPASYTIVGDQTAEFQEGVSTFTNLSLGTNGQHIFCSDCKNSVDNAVTPGAVCVGSGSGAMAYRINGTNRCY